MFISLHCDSVSEGADRAYCQNHDEAQLIVKLNLI